MPDYAEKYTNARQRILKEMMGLNWISWRYLRSIGGVRYSARLMELRRLGYLIEDQDLNKHGKQYRLLNPDPDIELDKRVKVYLPEKEVVSILGTGAVTMRAKAIIQRAYDIFDANRNRL